jgi:hypothetical protein
MPLRSTALVTVAAAKAYCGIPTATTDWDTVLETLIDGVSEGFNRFCDRVFAKTTYTSIYLDGPESSELILPNAPVVSITSVEEDGITLAEGEDDDYQLDAGAGILSRVGGEWRHGIKTIKITYVAGYVVLDGTIGTGETALPADVKLAALWQVAAEWQVHKNKTWGVTGRTFPDGSFSRVENGAFLKEVREALGNYTRC